MTIILWSHAARAGKKVRSFLEGMGSDDVVDVSFHALDDINAAFFEKPAKAAVLALDARLGVEARARWSAFLAGLCGLRHLFCLIDGIRDPESGTSICRDIQQEIQSDLEGLKELAPELFVFPMQALGEGDGDAPEGTFSEKRALTALFEGIVNAPDQADPLEESDQFAVHVYWLGDENMIPGRRVRLVNASGMEANAEVLEVGKAWSPPGLQPRAAKGIGRGEVGYCKLATDRTITFLPARRHSAFAHITLLEGDGSGHVGHGYIKHALRRASNIRWQALKISASDRARQKGQKPCVLWFTGLSGAGKSTIAATVDRMLHDLGHHAFVLDGDNVRHGLCKDLGFTKEDRVENIRRVAEVARLMVDAGLIVIVSLISPFEEDRRNARRRFGPGEFYEIFIDTPLEVCEARDPKGLYRKAREGLIRNFTGIDSPFEKPASPDLSIDGGSMTPEEAAETILNLLRARGHLSAASS